MQPDDKIVEDALLSMKNLVEKVTATDGPFPLAEEEVPHWGTTQKYLCFQDGPNSIVYHTLPDMFRDVFSRNSNKDCLVYEGERWTYGEVWERASALARTLAEDYGIGRGDCVAIAGRNSPDWVVAFLAATGFLSATALPVNSWWIGEELKYGLEDSGAKVLLADDFIIERAPFLETMKMPTILMRGASEKLPANTSSFEDLLTRGRSLPALKPRPVGKDDTAVLMYTSGTTSNPKGVASSHRGILTAINGYRVLQAAAVRKSPNQPVFLLGTPLFHGTGTHSGLLCALTGGAKFCTMRKWDAERALQIIQDEKVETLVGVPTMTYDIANHENFDKYDTSSLQVVGGGGSAFAPPMIKRVNDKIKTAKAGTGYGLTETNVICCRMPGNIFPLRPTAAGIPQFHLQVCILDVNDKKVGPGEVGEICFHGAVIMKEYHGKPDKTNEVFHIDEEGLLWFRTGDLGMTDKDGLLYVVDRAKDLIIRGGENISCSEVETAVFEHPNVLEVAAIGMPHEHLGEVVAVAVVARPGVPPPSAQEIKEVASKHLAAFKVPSEIYFWPDGLPRGATGKIQKREIRDILKEKRSQSKL